jgi:hypothetical protein
MLNRVVAYISPTETGKVKKSLIHVAILKYLMRPQRLLPGPDPHPVSNRAGRIVDIVYTKFSHAFLERRRPVDRKSVFPIPFSPSILRLDQPLANALPRKFNTIHLRASEDFQ